ncbi:large subunit ribosomal protein L9 [Kineococcus xinjiangensis]|uniref:Large ribosomal subunit protein bL9 n=1 Tax=Kineococcus xinjiangensis TaxID=512762 RepID=A0A2S6IVH6_9ACTN|nr:50S ribosomal protein L9 [Kineococcus xinjiangensis]PPK98208.1 large subunit ribosomal protein L9 [Kineococcus xinjiangensis]
MKLILTHEVTGLGAPGDVVEVKDGYGRNFLLPRNLATPWTKGGEKQVESIRKARRAREIASLEEAQQVKQSLEARTVRLQARAGQGGRLFGAITPADVAAAVNAAGGPSIDKRKVEIAQPIRATGSYKVDVRLHADVSAKVTVEVSPSAV